MQKFWCTLFYYLSSCLHLSFLEFPSNLISVLFKFLIHIFEIWSFLILFYRDWLYTWKITLPIKVENLPQTVSIKLFLLKHHISYLENLYLQLPFPPHRTNQRLSGNDTNIRNIPSSTLVAPGYTPHLRFHQLEERNGKRKYGIEIEQKEEQNTHFELNATRFEIFFFFFFPYYCLFTTIWSLFELEQIKKKKIQSLFFIRA